MINDKRIVPVYRSDYLSLIGTVFNLVSSTLGGSSPNYAFRPLDADNVNGDFTVGARTDPGEHEVWQGWIARQPARSINFKGVLDGVSFLFVPSYDFRGFYLNGSPAIYGDVFDDVRPDGVTLYLATLNDGRVDCRQMTPGV